MTIEVVNGKKGRYYIIRDDKGGILARFPTLVAAGTVKRFLNGDTISDAEKVFAIDCLNEYDAVNSGKKG